MDPVEERKKSELGYIVPMTKKDFLDYLKVLVPGWHAVDIYRFLKRDTDNFKQRLSNALGAIGEDISCKFLTIVVPVYGYSPPYHILKGIANYVLINFGLEAIQKSREFERQKNLEQRVYS